MNRLLISIAIVLGTVGVQFAHANKQATMEETVKFLNKNSYGATYVAKSGKTYSYEYVWKVEDGRLIVTVDLTILNLNNLLADDHDMTLHRYEFSVAINQLNLEVTGALGSKSGSIVITTFDGKKSIKQMKKRVTFLDMKPNNGGKERQYLLLIQGKEREVLGGKPANIKTYLKKRVAESSPVVEHSSNLIIQVARHKGLVRGLHTGVSYLIKLGGGRPAGKTIDDK